MFIAAITATYFARYAIKTNFMSEMINDRTQGIDQVPERLLAVVKMIGTAPSEWKALWEAAGTGWVYTPMWLPQIPMSIGAVLLAVALWDNLYRLLVNGENPISTETVDGDTSGDTATNSIARLGMSPAQRRIQSMADISPSTEAGIGQVVKESTS